MTRVLPAALLAACALAPASAGVVTSTPLRAESAPEQVHITTHDKQTLAADLYLPRKKTRVPAVLLVHDAGGQRSELVRLAESLQKRGLAALTLDLRGHGESKSEVYDWEELDEHGRRSAWAFTLRDLEAAAAFLRGRKEVHTSNLSVIGVRAGAALAMRYTVGDDNVRAVVLIDPEGKRLGFSLAQDVKELAGLPTLVVAPKGETTITERLIEVGHEANDGEEYIVRVNLKSERAGALSDKRLATEVVGYLREQVLPRRGR
ncbi:MAG: alpha/beta fold hydrolase [Planctomycetota bacterium]|jgi:dienelactone hydrolase|nr:alpha/beta fold hydrolase [Planctomycetota bacterium]MDP6762555.1 alpha/beta fold hydrolase [Planctomycetota bacterium]MDP6990994.1 alpha/beta fold hydrolase [Planctomycetota bacterium]